MSIDATPWQAQGETMAPIKRALAMAVRRALPACKAFGTPEWDYGTHKDAPGRAIPGDGSVIHLERLTWRLRKNFDFHERAMGEWSFVGVGWVADRRVEFAGEYLRDFATGAFWEFILLTME